ncbi:hypothetical protein IQ07DRAFT_529195 [Pyrenochaeta sp. DS3sAY3a]|nr:hypothetical protein IQ07DRAFT_529195 [Pyrenochaeta sp. DS3sAY3a]
MDHDDDAPNFAYAYGGASSSPSVASWNPALRDEKESSAPPSTKPTIAPPTQPKLESSEEEEEDDEVESDAEEEDDEDEERAEPSIAAAAPLKKLPPSISPIANHEDDEDEEDEEDDEDDSEEEDEGTPARPAPSAVLSKPSSGTDIVAKDGLPTPQNPAIASHEAHPPAVVSQSIQAEDESSDEESENEEESSEDEVADPERRPSEHYEHQGDTTALEEAVTENVDVPLVADTEAATDEWGTSGEDFPLGPPSQETPLGTPHVEAAGTTVGDNMIANTTVGGNAGEGIDWGNTEDQEDFFGNNTAKTIQPAEPVQEIAGAHVVGSEAEAPAKGDWDLDLDLDDDFLPDKGDAPVFDLSDDEGFLEEEEPSVPVQSQRTSSTSARYAPQSVQTPSASTPAQTPVFQTSPFAPQPPQQKSAATSAYNGYGQNLVYQQQPARPPLASSAQSFADKSKGGYASPYDLPDDIVTTRKRPAHRPSIPAAQPTPPPPPRSSSISSNTGLPRPGPPSNISNASLSPPSSSHSTHNPGAGFHPSQPLVSPRTASSDFFAELPVTSKPKPAGRYTPQPNVPVHPPAHTVPPHGPPKERAPSWSSLRNEVLPDAANAPPPFRQPEQLPMFPNQPSVPTRTNSLPVPQPAPAPPSTRYSPAPQPSAPIANARYSPAPPSAAVPNARYSPAPPANAQGQTHARYVSDPVANIHRTPSQPFAPRTSSPLAFHSVAQQQEQPVPGHESHIQHLPNHYGSQSADNIPRHLFRSPLEGVNENEEQGPLLSSRPPTAGRSETPPLRSTASSSVGSPRKKANYTPQYQPQHTGAATGPPPQRALSQSPTTSMKQPIRSASVSDQVGSAHSFAPGPMSYGSQVASSRPANVIPHRRQASLNYDPIIPEDERAADSLERWRGHPIFTWGLGGTIVTSFPKQIPRYGGGASAPMMKCSPGEVRIHSVKDTLPLGDEMTRFPGPLKAKSKKKEVSAWLTRKIEALDSQLKEPGLEHSLGQQEVKCLEDRFLLWKLMHILVENDGKLEGPAADAAVRTLLLPEGHNTADDDTSFSTAADLVGRSRSNTSNLQAEPVDARAIEDLQKMLSKGDREKAVWHAVDQRLWGHAMLLSSTLNKDLWKQVVQEFVRKEVKKVGRSNQALAVLYEVFAGNHEDCVDELVPASARAGFQMMSTDGADATQNAVQGLDKWRETVALILNNRSDGDVSALLSLGRLLAQYNRVEAAHICFIFARPVLNLNGVDDAQADLVLFGADHRQNPLEVGVELEPILLTEVYEFAMSLSSQSGSHIIPHLQNYKLAHAYQLAEFGYRTEAQAYCDAIAAAMKATTRLSPYYNASFIASLDDLSKRLSQSPKDGSSSWISKPSMDKVGSSLLSKFNSFIAGDDEDAASNHSAGAEVGPFAKIAGNSPTITPSQSSADLYGAYAGYGAQSMPSVPTNSRYAPSNAYAPRTSSEQQRPRYEPPGRPSMESADGRAMSDSYTPITPTTGQYGFPQQTQLSPPSQRAAKSQSYSPLRAEHNASQQSYGSPYLPTPPVEESSPATPFDSQQGLHASFDAPPPVAGSENSYGGYMPPSSNADDTPTYQPYDPDQDEAEDTQPKKKSFMDDDDDDDLAQRASALKISGGGKSEADKKADEAFRKAAEADAQRDKDAAAAKKGGWFGGWFKKDPNAAPGPIRAKLGEENSFVYDPDLKKWVNKKGGASSDAGKPVGTPPPPRGPPQAPRSASSGTPPMGPPTSAALRPPTSNPGPQRSSSMPPPMALPGSRSSTPGIPSDNEGGAGKPPALSRPSFGAASGPPSRPSTSMSNASSIDDLLGAPQARKGAGAKKKKGGRYIDVMAQGS